MKPEIVLKSEFVEFIPEELEERTLYVAAEVSDGGAPVLLLLRLQSRHAAFTGVVEADVRRSLHHTVPFRRQLEPTLPIALLDREQPSQMGSSMDAEPDRIRACELRNGPGPNTTAKSF